MFLGFPAFGRVDNEGNVVGRIIHDTTILDGRYKWGLKAGGQVKTDNQTNKQTNKHTHTHSHTYT